MQTCFLNVLETVDEDAVARLRLRCNVVHLGDIRSGLRQGREERRRLLTRGERVFAWSYTMLVSLLAPAGVVLLDNGAARGVGIALLVLALLGMAVPISPFLRARVRRPSLLFYAET